MVYAGNMMKSYKTFLAFIFVPYTLLIFMFHSQLPFHEKDLDPKENEGQRSKSKVKLNPRSEQEPAFRFRDLMINRGNSFQHQMDNLDTNQFVSQIKQAVPKGQVIHGPNANGGSIVHQWMRNDSRIMATTLQKQQAPSKAPITPASDIYIEPQNKINMSQSERISPVSMPVGTDCDGKSGRNSIPFQNIQGHYIYTAYYDDRSSGQAFIRVIALLRKADKPMLYCHIPSNHSSTEYVTTMMNYYEMCENHAKDYGGWILSCDVPHSVKTPPCQVIVSLHSKYYPQDKYDVTVPVFVTSPQMGEKKKDFGVCISPLFGHIPSTTLIEFIELTQILGAVHFTFYIHEVALEMTKVLQYYADSGLVSMIPWDLPIKKKAIWYHGQLLAINDCLYRNMHAFKYVAFNDIDEFIVPHRMTNWSSMVQQLLHPVLDHPADDVIDPEQDQSYDVTSSHNFCGFTFQSAFFDPMLTLGSSGGRVLYDLESDLRTKSFSRVRTKAMVDPSRIFELGIHHISKPLADHYKPYYVDPGDAFLHHYRKCITDFDPKMNCQIFTHDESLSHFIPTLRHNVHQTMWILKDIETKRMGQINNLGQSKVGQTQNKVSQNQDKVSQSDQHLIKNRNLGQKRGL